MQTFYTVELLFCFVKLEYDEEFQKQLVEVTWFDQLVMQND